MPLYDFRCVDGHKFERMVKLADFEVTQLCSCLMPATRVISAPMFNVEQVGYTCPVTGKYIGSKKAHEENLRQQDCRVFEPGEKELAQKRIAEQEAAFEKSVDQTVEKNFWSMPSDKREKIANELESGVDLAIERK